MDSQGPDRGTQYRSAIFYHSPEQKETAEKVAEEIKSKHPQVMKRGGFLATEIVEAGKWYTAEEYHQQYLDRTPGGYTCPTHRLYVKRFLRDSGLIVLSQVVVVERQSSSTLVHICVSITYGVCLTRTAMSLECIDRLQRCGDWLKYADS